MQISDVKNGSAIIYNNLAWTVIKITFTNPGKGAAFYSVKMKNIIQGNTIEMNIKSGETIKEANVERKKAQYLYFTNPDHTFMDMENFDQFDLKDDMIGDKKNFLLEGEEYVIQYLDAKPYDIQLPPKVKLKVTFAPPGDKGDTSGTALKEVETETGYTVKTPLFIKENDVIKVNTETGDYCEKA